MAVICPRWGCLKKARRVEMAGIPKKAQGVIRSSRNKGQKKKEVPVRLGFLGLPIEGSKGPRRNFLEGSEGCDEDDEGAHVKQSGLRPRDRLLGLTHFVNRIISGFR